MQFDVHRNENKATKKRFPYLLDVQADLLDSLETRTVIPLSPEKSSRGMILTRIMPLLTVCGKKHVAVTTQLAGIAKRDLGKVVDNLEESRADIIAALDMLFTGS